MSTEEMIKRSKEYINGGEFDKARIILRRALENYPNQAEFLELSGDLDLKLGNKKDAQKQYDHASDLYTQNGQYVEAIISLEKIFYLDPQNYGLIPRQINLFESYGLPNETIRKIIKLCSSALDHKDEESLLVNLRKVIDLQSRNLPLKLTFVKILFALNRDREAEEELTALRTQAEESNDEALLAEIKKLLPQYDGGEEELDPKSRLELGKLLYEIGSKDEAIIEFNKAVNDYLKKGENEEAQKVLSHIVEIDPNNTEAINKLEELKQTLAKEESSETAAQEAVKIDEPLEMSIQEIIVSEPKPEGKKEEIKEPTPTIEPGQPKLGETAAQTTDKGLEFLEELSREVEGFVAATGAEGTEGAPSDEELPTLDGHISEIESLLKEAEEPTPSLPSFDLHQAFEEFCRNIIWPHDDLKKKLGLAKMALEAQLYETTLAYLEDIKDKRESWPLALGLAGTALLRLMRHDEAMKTVKLAIDLRGIPEANKVELLYILALAYEGVGDFENAVSTLERVLRTAPDYKDALEIYELLGGKAIFARPQVVEKLEPEEKKVSPVIEKVELEEKKIAPVIKIKTIEEEVPIEPPPLETKKPIVPIEFPEQLPEEVSAAEEDNGRISFL